jgi:nucleotide-binding universal stress UspA family protein
MKILLAIDDSEFSDTATQAVMAQFRPQDTEIKILSVVEQQEVMGYPAGWAESEKSRAQELVNCAGQALRSAGFKVEYSVCEGEPRAGILDTAEEWQADLIVFGSHGRTAFPRFLLGSISDAVMRHAHCSVEIARPACIGIKRAL